MNFPEAKEYRDNCLYLIGTTFNLPDFPCAIQHLIIAPKEKTSLDRLKVFGLSMNGINANELALKKFDFMHEELIVYVLGVYKNIRYDMPLSEYLAESGQVPFEAQQ